MNHKVRLCALLAIMGVGFILLLVPAMAEMTYLVHSKEERRPGIFGKKGAYAQAYGLFNMAFAGGTLIGPLWGGFVERKAGWATVGWSLGLFVGVSVVPAVSTVTILPVFAEPLFPSLKTIHTSTLMNR